MNNKATLNLFNAIQVDKKRKVKDILLNRTIKDGYILAPAVAAVADETLLKTISGVLGIDGTKANNAFHKNWKTIKDTPQEALWLQAVVHYLTTYGFEALDMYREDSIYIPAEELKIPKVKDGVKLIVVKGLTKEELLEKIIELGGSGIALADDTLGNIMSIVEDNEYDSAFVKKIKNHELQSKLYDFYGIVPSEPVDFLRFVINKVSGESLLIKNGFLISKIKEGNSDLHVKTLDKALKDAPKNLASIFLRFKPLFLALKSVSKNKRFFNRLRKDADELHKPLPEDYLNTVTAKLKDGKKLIVPKLIEELDKVNIFRKIRLAYALKFRTAKNDAIVYRVRNGKGYAAEFEFDEQDQAEDALETVLNSIAKSLDVKGRVIYIPPYINYTLPATEKQFTGNFPNGTSVIVGDDMLVGIHWEDVKQNRIDLDLSTISADGKVGWDRNYSGEEMGVMFSGDMTAAPKPNGATELFYIKKGDTKPKLLFVNYFNFDEDILVPTKIIVAHEVPKNFGKSYMVNPNNIIAQANITVEKESNILGLITTVDRKNRFYFAQTSMSKAISSYGNAYMDLTREYMVASLVNTIDFKDILERAGATVVEEKPDETFLDLSPEALDKTTIINLITGIKL